MAVTSDLLCAAMSEHLCLRLITRDFNGSPFVFRGDGWFNMTKAAQQFGKDVRKFFANQETQDYLLALAANAPKSAQLIEAKRGHYGGTWGHPKVAVFFARWLDVRFAVWCDAVIEGIVKWAAQVTIVKPEESAALAVPKDYASGSTTKISPSEDFK